MKNNIKMRTTISWDGTVIFYIDNFVAFSSYKRTISVLSIMRLSLLYIENLVAFNSYMRTTSALSIMMLETGKLKIMTILETLDVILVWFVCYLKVLSPALCGCPKH